MPNDVTPISFDSDEQHASSIAMMYGNNLVLITCCGIVVTICFSFVKYLSMTIEWKRANIDKI